MSRLTGFNGFLAAYFFIIVLSLTGNFWLFELSDRLSSPNIWLYSISQSTLTHAVIDYSIIKPTLSYYIFSIVITQSAGWILFTILLWISWKIFGSDAEKTFSITKAFRYSMLVSVICETALFLFFLYAIPSEITNQSVSDKITAALLLAIHSFNNAGFSDYPGLLDFDVLSSNFMIQIGIIGGTILGNLGIFVLVDLLSPFKLRQRLKDPSIDWNTITKISFFGTAISLALFVLLFFVLGNQPIISGKNVLESLSFILTEGVSARGFGLDLIKNPDAIYAFIKVIYGFFSSGSFTTGGGVGLIFFPFLFVLINHKSRHNGTNGIVFSIVKNWLLMSMILLGISLMITAIFGINVSNYELFNAYSTNHILINANENSWLLPLLKSTLNFLGRISFIAACLITLKSQKDAPGLI